MSDLHDSAFDYLQQIGALIAAAQDIKNAHDYTYDAREVNEPKLKWIRHVKTEKRNGRSSNRSLQDFANATVPIDRRQSNIQDVQ